jgi:hypothetical protein
MKTGDGFTKKKTFKFYGPRQRVELEIFEEVQGPLRRQEMEATLLSRFQVRDLVLLSLGSFFESSRSLFNSRPFIRRSYRSKEIIQL